MRLEDYDLAVCGIVDSRYAVNRRRIEDLFRGRVRNLRFVVNGKGRLLPPEAYDFTTQDVPKGWVYTIAAYQHFVAFKRAVRMAKNAKSRSFLWIEDDCVLSPDFDRVLYEASLVKAPRWDLMYYGGNHSNAICREYSRNLMKVEGTLMAHMVGFRRKIYGDLLALEPINMIDHWLAHKIQTMYEAQALWPSVASQLPGVSTIWNSNTDYAADMTTRGEVL